MRCELAAAVAVAAKERKVMSCMVKMFEVAWLVQLTRPMMDAPKVVFIS